MKLTGFTQKGCLFKLAVTAWKVKFQLKIYSFNRIGMLFGHFNAKT